MVQNGKIIAVDSNTIMKLLYDRTFPTDNEELYQIFIPNEEVQQFEGEWLSIENILDINNSLSCEKLVCNKCGKIVKDIVVAFSYDKKWHMITLSNDWKGYCSDWLITFEEDKNAYTITLEDGFACPDCVKDMELLEQEQMAELHRIEYELDYWSHSEPDGPDWLGNSETEEEFWEHTD